MYRPSEGVTCRGLCLTSISSPSGVAYAGARGFPSSIYTSFEEFLTPEHTNGQGKRKLLCFRLAGLFLVKTLSERNIGNSIISVRPTRLSSRPLKAISKCTSPGKNLGRDFISRTGYPRPGSTGRCRRTSLLRVSLV